MLIWQRRAWASWAATCGSPPATSARARKGWNRVVSHRLRSSIVASVSGTTCHAVSAPRSHQNGIASGSVLETPGTARGWIGAEGLIEVDRHAHVLAVEQGLAAPGHPLDDGRQAVALGRGQCGRVGVRSGWVWLVRRAERQLDGTEHVLVGGPALVLHVGPAVRDADVALHLVDRQVVQEHVEHRRGAPGQVTLARARSGATAPRCPPRSRRRSATRRTPRWPSRRATPRCAGDPDRRGRCRARR